MQIVDSSSLAWSRKDKLHRNEWNSQIEAEKIDENICEKCWSAANRTHLTICLFAGQ